MSKKLLILGANGFIGSLLSEKILQNSDWHIYALDMADDKLENCVNHQRFHFQKGDAHKHKKWIVDHIKQCDVVLPLIAIANPALYVQNPLKVFELDFELNLEIIRYCVQYNKRVVFPSSSEVYGMCTDQEFDEEDSVLITGPISKQRWIYSCSKQMLDRVIYAYGIHENLQYSIFRPFNWIGPKLDYLQKDKSSARSLTMFISNILYHGEIKLVDGGNQRRSFIDINDAIDCLIKIIANKNNCANQQIFNIGNPDNDLSIAEFVDIICEEFKKIPAYSYLVEQLKITHVDGSVHYGKHYQDMGFRVPSIKKAQQVLRWNPTVSARESIKNTIPYYIDLYEKQLA